MKIRSTVTQLAQPCFYAKTAFFYTIVWSFEMTVKAIIDFIILSVTFGSAFVVVGYDDYARARGLPVGARLPGASLLKVVSLLMLFVSLGISFYVYRWWSPLIVFVFGFVYSFISLLLLKQRMRVVAALGAVIGGVLSLTYVLLVN